MKLARLLIDGTARSAVAAGPDDTLSLLDTDAGDLLDIIRGDTFSLDAIARLVGDGALEPVGDRSFRWLPPLERFRRDILCTGWNYWDHFEESTGKREGQDVSRPDAPTFFTKGPDTVIGPFDAIGFDPALSQKWDYEAEIAFVIGKPGRNIAVADAMDHVFGYTLANDVSLRDLQRRHGGQWLKGKSIDATMPIGPYIVPRDAVDLSTVHLVCELNGERVQDARAAQMAFGIAEIVAELSFGMTLQPGDLVLTGTPAGVGNARDPQLFLREGDEVVVRATGLGELRNCVGRDSCDIRVPV